MSARHPVGWCQARPRADVTGMRFPARCTSCGHVYDLGTVNAQNYADCSVWHCPGCQAEVSDRRGMPDHRYVELDADGYERRLR
jgi:hypothetical protein